MSKHQKNAPRHPVVSLPEDIRVATTQLATELLRLLRMFNKPPDKQTFANHIHQRFPDFKVFVWNPGSFYRVQLNCPAFGNLTFALDRNKCKFTGWQNFESKDKNQKTKGTP